MNDETREISMTIGFFRRYLLGTAIHNILIRFTLILSVILIIWCGIMVALIIHTKCQRAKQTQKGTNNHRLHHHHHLHDSTSSLTKSRPSNTTQKMKSEESNSSLRSSGCYSFCRFFSLLKRRCLCCLCSSSNRRQNSVERQKTRAEVIQPNDSLLMASRVHLVVEAMTRHPVRGHQTLLDKNENSSFVYEADSFDVDELQDQQTCQTQEKITVKNPKRIISGIDLQASVEKKINFSTDSFN